MRVALKSWYLFEVDARPVYANQNVDYECFHYAFKYMIFLSVVFLHGGDTDFTSFLQIGNGWVVDFILHGAKALAAMVPVFPEYRPPHGKSKERHQAKSLQAAKIYSFPMDKMAANLADDISECIFFNENDRILKCHWNSSVQFKSALFQVMVWRRTGDKPLPEQSMSQLIDVYRRHKVELR